MSRLRRLVPFAAIAIVLSATALPARAETIIEEWQNIKAPPAPQLKPVTLDPKTTGFGNGSHQADVQ